MKTGRIFLQTGTAHIGSKETKGHKDPSSSMAWLYSHKYKMYANSLVYSWFAQVQSRSNCGETRIRGQLEN